jgi:hypothetical protein
LHCMVNGVLACVHVSLHRGCARACAENISWIMRVDVMEVDATVVLMLMWLLLMLLLGVYYRRIPLTARVLSVIVRRVVEGRWGTTVVKLGQRRNQGLGTVPGHEH